MMARILVLIMFLAGLTGLVLVRNMIKKVYALSIMNSAVVILFVLEGSSIGSAPPLMQGTGQIALSTVPGSTMVDPVPQALMLTAIVVGVCVTALALALVYRLYRHYGTLDLDDIQRMSGHD